MKLTFIPKTLTMSLVILYAAVSGYSQTATPNLIERQVSQDGDPGRGGNNRQNLLRQLNLSREQIQLIRRNNMARRPLMTAAQSRLREANRQLDQAIYADIIDEAAISARTLEAQEAQSDLIRLRSEGELAIRKVLTPDQLRVFRELRERFEIRRDRIEKTVQERKSGNNPPNGPSR